MGSSRPRTKDFFAAPALSLSLAGAFGRNAPAATSGEEVEEGDEWDGGIRGERIISDEVEISSENTGPGSPSGDGDGEEGHGDGGNKKKRSRKSYHRHTADQVRVMEAVFKESPHPDEKQRQQLSEQLGLSPRQVKFWFQNRRTQIKAIQERHENSLLKSELENLQKENRAMRDLARRPSRCPNCGVAAATNDDVDDAAARQEQQLQLESAKLKAEIEKLRATVGKTAFADGIASPAFSAGTVQTNSRNPSEDYGGGVLRSHDKESILELAGRALEELTTMCSSGEPLWVRSLETGRDILNYDEYLRLFGRGDDSGDQRAGWSVEASRESGVVYSDAMQLVHAFMDVNQWKELFLPMIAKASTLDVIRTGENDGPDGVVQLMFAEVQMLTPMVPTRERYFARYCKKLAAEKWATVDVSFDRADASIDASLPARCWKNPSGCIIEEQTNGRSRVTWLEHTRCPEAAMPSMYRTVTASGLAFGARRWVATLQLQCERMVFSVATNVPTRDSNGVSTLAGRRSVLKLAHRMTSSLCRSIAGSRDLAWSRVTRAGAGDIRVTSRRSAGGEPQGLIACAVLSTWLPVSPTALLDFLRDESRRPEWDATLSGGSVQRRVNLAKGKDRGNCVTAYAARSSAGAQHGDKWIVQDSSCTSSCEAIVAYAPVDAAVLQPVISGHDSSGVAVLPCGFAVVPDGLEYSRPAVITSSSRKGDVAAGAAGSLVTVAFQVLASSSRTATLSADSAETVIGLVSCTLRDIKKALGYEDR